MTPPAQHGAGGAADPGPPESRIGSVAVGRYILEVGAPSGTAISEQPQPNGADASRLARSLKRKGDEPAAPPLEGVLDPLEEMTDKAERAAGLFKDLAEGAVLSPERLSAETDLLLGLLERFDRDQNWEEALRLARAASRFFAMAERWAALARSLRSALRAAQELGNSAAADVAWAQHELGTLHLAAEDPSGAERALREAREIRERLGDRPGIAATDRNLQVLCQQLRQLLREGRLVQRRVRLRRLLAVAAAALLLAGGVGLGFVLDGGGDSRDGGNRTGGGGGSVNNGPVPPALNGGGEQDGGDGLSPEPAALTPTQLDFGPISLEQASEAQSITATNPGPVEIRLGAFAVAGTDTSDFAIVSDGCSTASLPPDGTCSVEVQFAPTEVGDRSATLSLADDGTGAGREVALTGSGFDLD